MPAGGERPQPGVGAGVRRPVASVVAAAPAGGAGHLRVPALHHLRHVLPRLLRPRAGDPLRDKLQPSAPGLVGWRNFYRRTDPIGGPVFADTSTPDQDTEVPDPFPGPASDLGDTTPPLERDAAPWLRVAGHSHYMQEPVLKDWLRRVRLALDQSGEDH